MEKVEVTRYIAEDGKEFDTESDCVYYEDKMLKHRQLIDNFEIFDGNLRKIEKPKYLWSCDSVQLKQQLQQDNNFKDFNFDDIYESAEYVVFKDISDYQYQIIRDCFRKLAEANGGSNLSFPSKLEKIGIIYWTGDEWENFEEELNLAKEIFDVYDRLKRKDGGNDNVRVL